MVHSCRRYISRWMPRVNGYSPGSPRRSARSAGRSPCPYSGSISIPESVKRRGSSGPTTGATVRSSVSLSSMAMAVTEVTPPSRYLSSYEQTRPRPPDDPARPRRRGAEDGDVGGGVGSHGSRTGARVGDGFVHLVRFLLLLEGDERDQLPRGQVRPPGDGLEQRRLLQPNLTRS